MNGDSSSEYRSIVPAIRIDGDLIHYYSKLQTHRCWVLESIRAIAFRNMAYFVKYRPAFRG